jgi:signal transduction histidine kinase
METAAASTEQIRGLAHDVRSIMAALQLYCELVARPGVLPAKHRHYLDELKAISHASIELSDRLGQVQDAANSGPRLPLEDVAKAITALGPLLSALAGPSVVLEIECMACAGRVGLTGDELTRILANLVRNAVEAMSSVGHLRITAQYGDGWNFLDQDVEERSRRPPRKSPRSVVVAVQDNGPGISAELCDEVFRPGFTTRRFAGRRPGSSELPSHSGLGLSIVRRLVEEAAGGVRVVSGPRRGARFEVELPITYGMGTSGTGQVTKDHSTKVHSERGCIEC